MIKKYSYQIEFLSREISPVDTKYYSASAECGLRDMRKNFKDFLSKHGLDYKGKASSGTIVNAKGNVVGKFAFGSTVIE